MASEAAGAYPVMFSPLAVRGVLLRNRKVFQPHFAALGHPDGTPSDAHVAYHKDRARGGVGLIVIESQAVHPTGKMSRKFINAWDPAVISALRTEPRRVCRRLFGLSHAAMARSSAWA